MRPPTVLDIIQAVTRLAASHPEVAVWWYARTAIADGPPILLVLEPRKGERPDLASIGSELAGHFGPEAVAIRMHRGTGEAQALYRLLTTRAASAAAEYAGGS